MRRLACAVLPLLLLTVPAARAAFIPDDPQYPNSWYHPVIHSDQAWDYCRGSLAVGVAVLDAGIYADHPDLAGHVATGYNVMDGSTDTSPSTVHGTGVAGIIAGGLDNGIGGSGMGNFTLVPVKITASGAATSTNIVAGLQWVAGHAAEYNIRVLNLSYYMRPDTLGYADALAAVRAAGVLAVGSVPDAKPPFYPYGYVAPDVPNMLLVGSVGQTLQISSTSARGPGIDLVAPGEHILTTYYDPANPTAGSYGYGDGTSWAAPQVAGAAAMLFAIDPDLSVDEATDILLSTATDLGPNDGDPTYDYKLLDFGAAAQAAYALANPGVIPEPASLGLLAGGALALLSRRRRG